MRKTTRPILSHDKLRVSAFNLRALAHPLRLEIMTILDNCGSASVQDVIEEMKLEQSLISQHLKILRHAKLVSSDRQGKFVYYTIEYGHVRDSAAAINLFLASAAPIPKVRAEKLNK
jgi:ArsR family transcriptional regulator, virulence genes transcriptional regulator